jgi:glycosyltransferase involved in cell wall biosynthesis
MGLAADVTFISKSAAADRLGPISDATVIYNGLPASDEFGAGADPIELLYVGTSGLRKRTDLLPLILLKVRETFPNARLRIIGFDLDSHPGLRGHFGRLGLMDAVVCEGALTSGEIERFYRSARVLVVPSAYEGLPMVIMEAMRAGLPCVATAVGGNAEIIEHGVNGFLVEPDNPDAVAKYCIELLADHPYAQGMGEAGRTLLTETFTLHRQVEGYLSLYERLLVGPRRA